MNNLLNISPRALRRAADIQDKIVVLQNQMHQLLDFLTRTAEPKAGKRRRMSAQGLANIRAGVMKRWAAFRAGRKPAAKPKRRMSAAAKAKLAAVARARWRKAKKAGRTTL